MMEAIQIVDFLKQAAALGLTLPTTIGLYIIWQIEKKFNRYDIRISVLESEKQGRRCNDL